MRLSSAILIFLIGQFFMACNNENDRRGEDQIEVEHIVSTSEEDDPGPPPPDFTSPFMSLEEWLLDACDNEEPKMPITTYRFMLFEGEGEYTLCLTGINTYELSQRHTQTRIDFEPGNMYFTLPDSAYKNLGREQVLERLTSQLKAFTTTDRFKHSFLAEAKYIRTDWSGAIWSR